MSHLLPNLHDLKRCSKHATLQRLCIFPDRFHLVADGRILQAYSKLQQLGNLRHVDIFGSHLSAAELGIDVREVAELKQRVDEVRLEHCSKLLNYTLHYTAAQACTMLIANHMHTCKPFVK